MWQTGDKSGFQHWSTNGSEEFSAASGDPQGFGDLAWKLSRQYTASSLPYLATLTQH